MARQRHRFAFAFVRTMPVTLGGAAKRAKREAVQRASVATPSHAVALRVAALGTMPRASGGMLMVSSVLSTRRVSTTRPIDIFPESVAGCKRHDIEQRRILEQRLLQPNRLRSSQNTAS